MSKAHIGSSFHRVASCCLAALAFAAGPVAAAPITYDFTAEMSLLSNIFDPDDLEDFMPAMEFRSTYRASYR